MSHLPIGQDTFRLFDRPSFWQGFAGLLDFRPNVERYHTNRSEAAADLNSIAADWKAVGRDIKTAVVLHGGEKR